MFDAISSKLQTIECQFLSKNIHSVVVARGRGIYLIRCILNIKGTGNGLGNGPVAGARADNRGGSVYFNNKAFAKACKSALNAQ